TQDSPCYRCLYSNEHIAAESCAETGVVPPLLGIIGSLQAIETLKLLIGIGESLEGRLLRVNALTMECRTSTLTRDPNCPVCRTHRRDQDEGQTAARTR
ncbi:MAG: hypothetical protein L0Y67_06495, partial [Gammaproteobacteria bacterium]|nr:hypothetical protein [Gammaproteobacteria bacterium]